MSADDIPLLFHTSRRVRREELRQFLKELTRRIARGRTIACVIADDAEIRRLNRQFRGKNYTTDVLSFPATDRNGLAGDIAISIDRARVQAAQRGHSLADEMRILMLHGALHLAGLDHEADSGEMAQAEVRWRKRLGLPHGLIEWAHGGGMRGGNVKKATR
jgi:probable rRNA maturation factor